MTNKSHDVTTATGKLLRAAIGAAIMAEVVFGAVAGRALLFGPGADAGPAPAATVKVFVEPSVLRADVGGIITANIVISGVVGLYGGDARLSFDPAVVAVLDANAGQPGLQIIPGPLLQAVDGGFTFILKNEALNATGAITYVSFLVGAEPVTGTGVLASIRFQALSKGISGIRIVSVTLADRDGIPIPGEAADGSVSVWASSYLPLISR